MISDNPPGAIALLVVVLLLLFVATPAWLIWAARTWVWPKGFKRVSAYYMGYRCSLLHNDAVVRELLLSPDDLHKLARAGAKAAWAVDQAYKDVPLNPQHEMTSRLKHVVLMLLTDEDYNGERPRDAEINAQSNAHLGKIGKRVTGDYLPMMVGRSRFYSGALARGSIVIHELVHEVVRDTPGHKIPFDDRYEHFDERLWENHGPHTLEARARKLFIEAAAE